MNTDEDYGKNFYSDILRYIASDVAIETPADPSADDSYCVTHRDVYHGTREDVSTESGVTVSDESSLLMDARPSTVDMGKQKEVVNILVKFLHVRGAER